MAALLFCITFASCLDQPDRAPTEPVVIRSNVVTGFGQGELLGDVFNNGSAIVDSNWTVELAPRNQPTADRLGPYWSGEMWVSPTRHGRTFMFEWIDPQADGACGSLSSYLANDTTARGGELHRVARNIPPSGIERHCIRPGEYTLTILQQNHVVRTIDVDYVPVRGAAGSGFPVFNATAGEAEYVEELNYDATQYMWSDLVVNFDVGTPSTVDTPRLLIENIHGNPYADTFVNDASPSGTTLDYFRFSSRTSSSSIIGSGRLLSRLFWNSRMLSSRTGYWDSHSNAGVIRTHQFHDDVTETRVDSVGLDTRRPSETPVASPAYWRTIALSVSTPPIQTLRVFISGPDLLDPTETVTETWTATADYGVDPYTYGKWYYFRYPGPESVADSGDTHVRDISPTSTPYVFRLRATAADVSPQSATGKYFVEVVPPGGGGDGIMGRGGNITVRLSDGTCGERPTSGPMRQAWLQWVFEQRAGQVEECR